MILLSFCSECTWSILPFLLGAWLLGWLFWWLFNKSKYQTQINGLEDQIDSWKNKSNQFETELASAKYELDKLAKENNLLRSNYDDTLIRLKACEEQQSVANAATIAASGLTGAISQHLIGESADDPEHHINFAAAFQSDNLQVVEGIGPKIEKLLKEGGIRQWSDLAIANQESLKKILEAAGPRYRVHDPKTWPEQAKMAQSGEWQKLLEYQALLGGGRDTDRVGGGNAKIEKLAAKILGIPLYQPNDLKVVEGIGPKIEKLLKEAGIMNWKQLAEVSTAKIQEVLTAAGGRYRLADPTTWPKQAGLADAGKWKELKTYQDALKGGKMG